MRKKGFCYYSVFVLSALGVLVAPWAQAKVITPQTAARVAAKYVALPRGGEAKAPSVGVHEAADAPYYIFNDAQERGFVIVAADDAMGEVLAYGTEGVLDTLNANPCVKMLLEGYRQTFEVLKEGRVAVCGNSRAGLFTNTVSPLLKSKWGQSHPFNAKTGYPYSGCVATAVAQMMYYYQWPAQGRGANEYIVNYDNTKLSADFSQSHYDWANMLPDYRYPVRANEAQEAAVAQLMSDVGIASFMQYTPSASGTQGIMAYHALQKHFDYTAAYVVKATEGPSRFAEILRQELLNGCPVYLEGLPKGNASGHAWVADGFDEHGLFHMNFGWEGQGDAYYSLTNLSLSQTGDEFDGKPLAFNRAITAILAHPNNGAYPDIDRGLLESSPQLMFNEGGSLLLKGVLGKTFNLLQPLTVEMNSFVNRGKPFRGDIGVAVYDEEGNLKRVAYSPDHASGGFTQRVYGADHAGFMGTDYLMNQPQAITISVSDLENGYYRLVPVCVPSAADGTWGEIFRMKKAPVIEVELTDGTGRISEICSEEVLFQLMAQPRLLDVAEQGEKVQAIFTVKNLNGVPRDCYMRVQLLDANNATVLNVRTDKPTEIEGFTEAEIPIVLSIPTNLNPTRYEVKLQLSTDEAETQLYPINPIHDKDAAYIEVEKNQEKPLMAKTEVFWVDDSNEKVSAKSIDITKFSNFKIGVSLLASEGKSYEGTVSMLCEDVQTNETTAVRGIDDYVSINSTFEVPLYSYWLRKSNLPWADGHTYRVKVMGQIDGDDVDLQNPQLPIYYLKREADILTLFHPDITTGITAPTATSCSIIREGNQLTVSAPNLKAVRLYSLDGRLLQTSIADGAIILTLPGSTSSIYILQTITPTHSQTHKIK